MRAGDEMVMRVLNLRGGIDNPVAVTVIEPCHGEINHYRITLPDGSIGCASADELSAA